MKRLRTLNFWLIVSALLILAFLFFKTEAIDTEEHNQFSRDLRQMTELDSVVTQNMLKLRVGLLDNYDPLIRDLEKLEIVLDDLASQPSFIDAAGKEQFTTVLKEYRQTVEEKEDLIDDFKSRHSIYKTSIQHILEVSSKLAQNTELSSNDPYLVADLNSFMHYLLSYHSRSDEQISSQLAERREKISQKQGEYAALLREEDVNLAYLMSHSQVVLAIKPRLDMTIEEISNLETAQIGERLIKIYDFHYQAALETTNFYRLSLYLFSLLMLGYVASVIIIRLTKAEQVLAEYNRTLEEQVLDRTTQLATASAEIQALNDRLKAENSRLGDEINVSRRLQQMLLPTQDELEAIKELDMASFVQSADEVGGDYVDVLQHNGQVKIGIGDVTGHGLESGMLMLMTQTAVRALLISGETNSTRFLNIVNRTIYDNVQRMQANKSLTLTLLDYHPSGHLRLSGQHEELIILRRDGEIELVDTDDLGFPIGLDDDISDFVDEKFFKLNAGDGVVLYTDGITEAENMEGEQYGLERLCTFLQRHWSHSAELIKELLIKDLYTFIGEQTVFDDITLLVIKQQLEPYTEHNPSQLIEYEPREYFPLHLN